MRTPKVSSVSASPCELAFAARSTVPLPSDRYSSTTSTDVFANSIIGHTDLAEDATNSNTLTLLGLSGLSRTPPDFALTLECRALFGRVDLWTLYFYWTIRPL